MRIILNSIFFYPDRIKFNIDIVDVMRIKNLIITFDPESQCTDDKFNPFLFITNPKEIENISNNIDKLIFMSTINDKLEIKFSNSDVRESSRNMVNELVKMYKVLKDNTISLVLTTHS